MNKMLIKPSELKADISIEQFIDSYVCEAIRDIAFLHSFAVKYTVSLFDQEVLVRGEIKGYLELSCAKCLEKYKLPVSIPIVQSYQLGNEDIDIEPEVRELVVLNMPDRLVCSNTCSGLCPICGKNKNKEKCTCVKEDFSPQWEGLKNIVNKLGGKNAKSKT